MNFKEKLKKRWNSSNSLVCVGLDPDTSRFPEPFNKTADHIFQFNRAIIDATYDLVCAYKPQIAYFSAEGAEKQLEDTIAYIKTTYPEIPIILDSKRADIGSTAQKYAAEAFDRYRADAVTVNPYLGYDSVAPFTAYKDKGVIILCRTSNPGAADIQDLEFNGRPLYKHIAEMICSKWNKHNNCCMVVGATWPSQMREIRDIAGDMPFLVPGVGAQGGDVKEVVRAGQDKNGAGMIINSSRGVLYAGSGEDFAQKARESVIRLKNEINLYRDNPAEKKTAP